ncbi:Uncharacterised protein [Mycobacteroides abscessus]|nr:Uncharacterised protein [Mycobacteroides abscessus]
MVAEVMPGLSQRRPRRRDPPHRPARRSPRNPPTRPPVPSAEHEVAVVPESMATATSCSTGGWTGRRDDDAPVTVR